MIVALASISSAEGNNGINKLDTEFQQLNNEISSNPDNVLKRLLANTPKNNPDIVIHAQYHLLLSNAYNTLVYSKQAINQAQIGLSYITQENQPWLYHMLNLTLASSYDSFGQPAKRLKEVENALQWSRNQNDLELSINALITLGYIQNSLTNYTLALDTLLEAYQLTKNSKQTDPAEVAGIIALVYEYRNEALLSIPYFQEAVNYHKIKNNWVELSITLYGLGRAHAITGKTQLGKNELQESAEISVEINDIQGAAYAWKELAGIAINAKKYTYAKELIEKSLENFKLADNKIMQFDIYMILSRLSVRLNKANDALFYINEAAKFIDEKNQPLQFISYLKQFANVIAANGSYEEAYKKLWNAMIKEKSQLAQQSTKQLHQMRAKYELENKEQQNKNLAQKIELNEMKIKNQNRQNYDLRLKLFLTLLIIVLLLFLAFRFRQNKLYFEKLANFDNLTGLYTRSKALELMNQDFNINKNQFSIAMIDLDLFKEINDTHGHLTGDEVLKQLGNICQNILDNSSICGRFGGEEFIIGFKNMSNQQVRESLEKLRVEIMEIPRFINTNDLNVSISTGFCHYNSHKILDDMIKCADDALYHAKSNGRNQLAEG